MMHMLTADIGGTNSRFAKLQFRSDGSGELIRDITFPSKSVKTFAELLSLLRNSELGRETADVDCFVIAMTGPVKQGTYCRSVSLAWDVDLERDRAALPVSRVFLINDFLAQAFATLSPIAKTADVILPGKPQFGSTIAVIGAGTGLGEAVLVPDDRGHYIGCPSEGGHQSFAAEDSTDIEFLKFACAHWKTPYIEWDDVVSGRGLAMIHRFISGEEKMPHEVPERFSSHPGTLEYFARCYGRACRKLALGSLPYSGMFLAGGIAAKNSSIVQSQAFRQGFQTSKSYSALLESIPVSLFDDEDRGLWGAGWYGRERLMAGASHGR